ncbi:hypothetical protein AADZ86_00855 [Colwelliaceae bacterium BS250]
MAEERDINLTDIANIIGCSQPYVSQLKSGKGKAKVKDIQPLIHLLSSTVPGSEFHTYNVLTQMSPMFPDNWEEEVLLTGISLSSEQTPNGRYPTGDDGFDVIEKNHYQVVEMVKDHRNTYLNIVDTFQIPSIKARLEEALDAYLTEKNKKEKLMEESQNDLQAWVIDTLDRLNYKYSADEKVSIEEKLIELAEPRYTIAPEQIQKSDSWGKNSLLQLCNQASDVLSVPILIQNNPRAQELDVADTNKITAPEKHAQRLIDKLNHVQATVEVEMANKRDKFRLKNLFKKKVWERKHEYPITNPKVATNWESFAQDLYGDTLCKVFRFSNQPAYEVNLTDSFKHWANDLKFNSKEEDIQICGPIVISSEINESQITIHELYSKKFIIIHTFYSDKVQKEISILSEPLDTSSLFDEIQNEAKIFQWEEGIDSLIKDVKTSLSSRGYRVPGIRSIY